MNHIYPAEQCAGRGDTFACGPHERDLASDHRSGSPARNLDDGHARNVSMAQARYPILLHDMDDRDPVSQAHHGLGKVEDVGRDTAYVR